MLRQLRSLIRKRDGMAAVEFALIAPVLGTMLLGTIELCNALQCHQKVTMVASTASDLVAQATTVSSSDMNDVFSAATAVVYPFNQNNVSIVVSSVLSDGTGNGTVSWSVANANGTKLPTDTPITLSQPIMSTCDANGNNCTPCAKGACSVILTQVSYGYVSPIGKFLVGSVPMTDYFYERPRKAATVSYTG
ncbi:MAG TPA: TadE/TadG family type IV pilus assembly protein [Rhizomicrobium sp.]|nr:TadE/TadG family type IV pilus assembly protein [Rhizomicrobium sp.]